MQKTLYVYTSLSIRGRPICNLRFADGIDHMASSNSEMQDLIKKLVENDSEYGMTFNTEKSKVMRYGWWIFTSTDEII